MKEAIIAVKRSDLEKFSPNGRSLEEMGLEELDMYCIAEGEFDDGAKACLMLCTGTDNIWFECLWYDYCDGWVGIGHYLKDDDHHNYEMDFRDSVEDGMTFTYDDWDGKGESRVAKIKICEEE